MTPLRVFCFVATLLLGVLSCSQPVMVMLAPGPARPVIDKSVDAPKSHAFRVVMVLPPEGVLRDPRKVPEFTLLERELLKRGISVISAGMTGRVAIESRTSQESGAAATNLSQLERALVLAKSSHAEALLQVELYEWEPYSRFFVYPATPDGPPVPSFRETSSQEWQATPPMQRYTIQGPALHLVGKLINVDGGEVASVIDLTQSTTELFSPEFAMRFKWVQGKGFDPPIGSGGIMTDSQDSIFQARDKLMTVLADRVLGPTNSRPAVFMPTPMQPPGAPPPPAAVASPGR